MADVGDAIRYEIPTRERGGASGVISGEGTVIEVLPDGRYVTQEADGSLRAVPADAVV